jgi:hypothetical protein
MGVMEVAIGLAAAPGAYAVQVLSSPAGEAAEKVVLDVEDLLARLRHLQDAVLASSVSSRRIVPESEQRLRQVGVDLFAALLGAGEVAGRYRATAALAEAADEGVRIVIRIDDASLAGLPWEAMYDSSLETYVCRHEQLVRRVPVARTCPPAASSPR